MSNSEVAPKYYKSTYHACNAWYIRLIRFFTGEVYYTNYLEECPEAEAEYMQVTFYGKNYATPCSITFPYVKEPVK